MVPRDPSQEAGRSQELQALVKLRGHEYLFVKFFGWYEDVNHTYFAMEYIEHGDLSGFMKDPRAKAEAKEITKQILEGLEVLHSKEIYHRDLKPQNILMASLDPIWVKIADFGVSKRVKDTQLQTLIGTQGYLAPELLGLMPQFIPQGFIPYALDIWSLGSLVHELLTSETPFTNPGPEEPEKITGIETGLLAGRVINMGSLWEYCKASIEFPTDALQKSQLDEEEIAFVKSLLVANPNNRPTATQVLQKPWLVGQTFTSDWLKGLKEEFLCLGVDLDLVSTCNKNIVMRQIGKEDVLRFLPGLAKDPEKVLSLILEAVAKGYNLAISKILESPDHGLESMDNLTRGKLFQTAIKAGQIDTMKMLLRKGIGTRACVGDETVLQWAVKAGDINTVSLILSEDSTTDILWSDSCRKAFILAATSGKIDILRFFLKNGFDIDSLSGNQTILPAVAQSGYIDIVKLFLDSNVDVNAKGASGLTALHAAVENGHIDIVRLLLDRGADVDAGKHSGKTPLEVACEGGRTGIVKLLLDSEASVNLPSVNLPSDQDRHLFLEAACKSGNIDIVKLLLDKKAIVNPRKRGYVAWTALQEASRGGHINIVQLLLDNKADVNFKPAESGGRTALQAASGGGHINVVRLLLDHKANVNSEAAYWGGRTALQAACESGYINIVQLLLDHKANVNSETGYDSMTALQAASGAGHIGIVQLLLDHKANVNSEAARWDGRTALQAACESGHIDIVRLLLDNKANVNHGSNSSQTPLWLACSGGHAGIVKLLLDNKADVNWWGQYDKTALKAAASSGNISIVKMLLDNQVDVNRIHTYGSALVEASSGGHTRIVELLLDKKASIEVFKYSEALREACKAGHTRIVELLLETQTNVNSVGYGEKTALELAASGGYTSIVKLLLENKADVNRVDNRTPTALQAASRGGYIDIVKLLLDNKVDVNVEGASCSGRTALHAAAAGGHIEIIELLLDNEAIFLESK